MRWPRLDTRAWNLGYVAATTTVLTACGPMVPIEGETDTNAATDTDPAPTEATDTTPGPCDSVDDCGPGESCIDGICQPYDYYCQDGTAGCCYGDDCYYEPGCYSDEECGYQSFCDAYYAACTFVEALPECETGPSFDVVDLPVGEGDPIVSLAFVDVNGDAARDLVVGRSGSAQVHLGPDGAFPLTLPVPPGAEVTDAVFGDLDGDGDGDIVAATAQGSLLVLTAGGPLGFELAAELPMGQPITDLATLDFDGDAAIDVVGIAADGQAVVSFGDGLGGFQTSAALLTTGPVQSLAVTDYGDDALGDVVLRDDMGSIQVHLGGSLEASAYLHGIRYTARRLVAGPIGPSTPWEVLGHTSMPGGDWLLLELWTDGIDRPQSIAILGDANRVELGDLDGNGSADLVIGGTELIQYALSGTDPSNPSIECLIPILGTEIVTFTVGDFDGNGRADVALRTTLGVSILRTL